MQNDQPKYDCDPKNSKQKNGKGDPLGLERFLIGKPEHLSTIFRSTMTVHENSILKLVLEKYYILGFKFKKNTVCKIWEAYV